MTKTIDSEYALTLANDLAYTIVEKEFFAQRKWFLDLDEMDPLDPLRPHVMNTTWPTPLEIREYRDKWHKLPLIPCYTVPQTIDPAVLYSDWSHSMNRTEVLQHIQNYPNKEIPSRKVLKTALKTPQVDIGEFLQEINDCRLRRDDLIIGLKGKE